jgi:hypothetical protein
VRSEILASLKKVIHLIGFRTVNFSACSVIVNPTRCFRYVFLLEAEGIQGSSAVGNVR